MPNVKTYSGVNLNLIGTPPSGIADFTAPSPGAIIKKVGNYYIKTVDESANVMLQAYARSGMKAQAQAFEKLGDMAPSFIYKNDRLISRDAGSYQSGDFWGTWLEGSRRMGTPMNDIRPRNIGANGVIFDPALDPVSRGIYWGAAGTATLTGGFLTYEAVISK